MQHSSLSSYSSFAHKHTNHSGEFNRAQDVQRNATNHKDRSMAKPPKKMTVNSKNFAFALCGKCSRCLAMLIVLIWTLSNQQHGMWPQSVQAKPIDVPLQIPLPLHNDETTYNDQLEPNLKNRSARNAFERDTKFWENAVVPFVIDPSLKKYLEVIFYAMNDFHQNTCIQFRRRTTEATYVHIIKDGDNCYANGIVGSGPQNVSLGRGCYHVGTVIHELGHAIGLQHEHKRPDSNQFVTIHRENVLEQFHSQFDQNSNIINQSDFDHYSIMIYGEKTYSSNGQNTISPKVDGVTLTEPHEKKGLSELDIQAINKLYNCTSTSS